MAGKADTKDSETPEVAAPEPEKEPAASWEKVPGSDAKDYQGIKAVRVRPGKHNPEKAEGMIVAKYVGAGLYFIAGVPARDLDAADIAALSSDAQAALNANLASQGPPDGPDLAYQGV